MDKGELKHLANLARIEMSDEDMEVLKGDFESILEYVSQIASVETTEAVDTRGLQADTRGYALINVTREDSNPHKSGVYTEALLGEAPEREREYIKVKKIL